MTCAFSRAAYRNRTDDLFITRELHQRKALNCPAPTASTKATQLNQHDQIEVMYAQKTPTRTLLAASTYTRSKTDAGMPTSGHWHTTVRLEVAAVGDLVVTASPASRDPHPRSAATHPPVPMRTHTRPPNT